MFNIRYIVTVAFSGADFCDQQSYLFDDLDKAEKFYEMRKLGPDVDWIKLEDVEVMKVHVRKKYE